MNTYGYLILLGSFCLQACSSSSEPDFSSEACASSQVYMRLKGALGGGGTASVFSLDPISSSGRSNLLPTDPQVASYTHSVSLDHLSGYGVLHGTYVEVVNGKQCKGGFGAFEKRQKFEYDYSNPKFQETMAYYYGDLYQSRLKELGYLPSSSRMTLVAHCELDDNAYYYNGEVCLGDSTESAGASYSDDSSVITHEIQHGQTEALYSPSISLNQLWYDESGALNEAISDFMTLLFNDRVMDASKGLDARIFSRWALGKFDPQVPHYRGAHRCPTYDSSFPQCNDFPNFSDSGSASYIYPDGMGWPYASKFSQSDQPIRNVWEKSTGQEEIHQNSVLMTGALWDVYQAMKGNYPNAGDFANSITSQLVLETIRHLPFPDAESNLVPVTFIEFASRMMSSSSLLSGLSAQDRTAIDQALAARGLTHFDEITDPQWLDPSAEIVVEDNPTYLKAWLSQMGGDPRIVTQSGTENGRLDPGEVAAIWFDLVNNSPTTAGGVRVTVSSGDSDLAILNGSTNIGYLNSSQYNETQVMYGKINGTQIGTQLDFVGNSYGMSNPRFSRSYTTAIWVKIAPDALPGKIVPIYLTATPSNGVSSTQTYSVVISI